MYKELYKLININIYIYNINTSENRGGILTSESLYCLKSKLMNMIHIIGEMKIEVLSN